MSANVICGLILLSSLFNCTRRHSLRPYPDPYLDSFRNRGIQYMISVNDSIFADTIIFNRYGDIDEIKSRGLRERRSYDSLFFIRRKLRMDDIPANYFIEYYFNNAGQLVQEWREVNHFNWSSEKMEERKIARIILFDIGEDGEILEELDTAANEVAVFFYDDKGKLVTKEILSVQPRTSLLKWKYEYTKEGKLENIRLHGAQGNYITHYYSNGLLDSTVNHIKGYTKTYRYIFY